MRIGFFNAFGGTIHAGGIAIYLQQIAANLSEQHEVYLYTRSGDITSTLTESDVTIVESPAFNERVLNIIHHLTPITKEDAGALAMTAWGNKAGVLDHIEDNLDLIITFTWLEDLLLSNLVSIPTIYQFHGLSQVGLGAWIRDRFSQTDAILANSHDTAEKAREHFDIDINGIVYPGVDLDRFTPTGEASIQTERDVVLFVGRLFPEKGVLDLLEAVAHLGTDPEVHLIGYGDESAIRTVSSSLGLEDSVAIHGEVEHRMLPRYYRSADVFCLPSHYESFGMVNIEAMACGTPVVTSDVPAIRRYVTDWENGLLVRPGDPIDIAAKLETTLSSAAFRHRLAERGRQKAMEYDWKIQAEAFERVCAAILGTEEPDDRARPPGVLQT